MRETVIVPETDLDTAIHEALKKVTKGAYLATQNGIEVNHDDFIDFEFVVLRPGGAGALSTVEEDYQPEIITVDQEERPDVVTTDHDPGAPTTTVATEVDSGQSNLTTKTLPSILTVSGKSGGDATGTTKSYDEFD